MFREDIPYEEIKPKYTKENWEIGFGLQAIDNLQPSEYLKNLADEQTQGKLTYEEIEDRLTEYYEDEQASANDNQEADFTSMRIAQALADDSFSLSPATLLGIHRRLFSGIETFIYPVGKFRETNISKKEPVLNGETVRYADFRMIKDTLNWEFDQEKEKNYRGKAKEVIAHEVMEFISNVWQVHPFREGNTRTIAVFAIKYLRLFGFKVDNEPFKEHSKFFRDSLALSHANPLLQTNEYLKMFTENLLLDKENELKINLQ